MNKSLLSNQINMLYDNYLSNPVDENISLDKLDIIHLFGREKLEQIQTILSNTTGLAFVTVDYKGDAITNETSFSEFCKNIRNSPLGLQRCKSSDAFGSIQASVTQKANVYFCPCGLTEVAIPIIIQGHYLGGFIGGQIRCNDAPNEICNLKSVMPNKELDNLSDNFKYLFNDIPIFPYNKLKSIAELVQLVVNQLGENLLSKHINPQIATSKLMEINEINNYLKKDLDKVAYELDELKSSTNLYALLDIITLITNLSIIEKATNTESALSLLSEYIKYTHQVKEPFTNLKDELKNIENYLSLQKLKYKERLLYSIDVDSNVKFKKIPSKILFPFIENALYNGILLNKNCGSISIVGKFEKNETIITICDNGPGLTDEELFIHFEDYEDRHEGYYIKLGIDSSIKKLKNMYGDKFEFEVNTYKLKGREYKLIWK